MLFNASQIKQVIEEITNILEELRAWETDWLGLNSKEQEEQLDAYLENKQSLINQAQNYFQTDKEILDLTDDDLRQLPQAEAVEIYDRRQEMDNLFKTVLALHTESQQRLEKQSEQARQDLEVIQKTMTYVQSHRMSRQVRQRIDITQ